MHVVVAVSPPPGAVIKEKITIGGETETAACSCCEVSINGSDFFRTGAASGVEVPLPLIRPAVVGLVVDQVGLAFFTQGLPVLCCEGAADAPL